ncbi:MAG: isoprenylcysteine carboxylmethyltransferase family protein [Candidatus Thermoplasmatota archaeon]|nr:isoprenylcysteine carboxylmethyltransferase family protein [Candidatus Thermoplasmatota archaeon]
MDKKEVIKMSKKMTVWGIGPKLVKISLLYLAFTIILHFIRPDIFTITQISYLVSASLGIIFIVVGLVMWRLGVRVIEKAINEGRLLTKGVYAIVRNPMYSGPIIFFATGLALCFRSWLMLTVPIVAYIVCKLLIKEEENYLEKKFGQEFLDYKSKVNALIPFPHFTKLEKK